MTNLEMPDPSRKNRESESPKSGEGAPPPAPYSFPERTLEQWARRFLKLAVSPGEEDVSARFEIEGTTCSDPGSLLRFVFEVELSRTPLGHRVRSSCCRQPERAGWRKMCSALTDTSFVSMVEAERPFQGRLLEEAAAWRPTTNPAGCLCSENNRNHLWQMVFQTLHYAVRKRGPQ